MQTLIQVLCRRGRSLREAIADDGRLSRYGLEVVQELKAGRSPGWMKLKSVHRDHRGAINVEWDPPMQTLRCRVVTKGRGRPGEITAEFLHYLLAIHHRRIESVLIRPG
ncbi:MAG: hypothetical protein E4G90_02560 [Gemmatimonadales bacterium]|nr:MAG: hypothetical protein E4G90_02560 [Gemmatimonadales bacterium]